MRRVRRGILSLGWRVHPVHVCQRSRNCPAHPSSVGHCSGTGVVSFFLLFFFSQHQPTPLWPRLPAAHSLARGLGGLHKDAYLFAAGETASPPVWHLFLFSFFPDSCCFVTDGLVPLLPGDRVPGGLEGVQVLSSSARCNPFFPSLSFLPSCALRSSSGLSVFSPLPSHTQARAPFS